MFINKQQCECIYIQTRDAKYKYHQSSEKGELNILEQLERVFAVEVMIGMQGNDHNAGITEDSGASCQLKHPLDSFYLIMAANLSTKGSHKVILFDSKHINNCIFDL